jgi:hypothetical protein
MPKQDILLGINTDYLVYKDQGKEVRCRRVSFGFVLLTLSIFIYE